MQFIQIELTLLIFTVSLTFKIDSGTRGFIFLIISALVSVVVGLSLNLLKFESLFKSLYNTPRGEFEPI